MSGPGWLGDSGAGSNLGTTVQTFESAVAAIAQGDLSATLSPAADLDAAANGRGGPVTLPTDYIIACDGITDPGANNTNINNWLCSADVPGGCAAFAILTDVGQRFWDSAGTEWKKVTPFCDDHVATALYTGIVPPAGYKAGVTQFYLATTYYGDVGSVAVVAFPAATGFGSTQWNGGSTGTSTADRGGTWNLTVPGPGVATSYQVAILAANGSGGFTIDSGTDASWNLLNDNAQLSKGAAILYRQASSTSSTVLNAHVNNYAYNSYAWIELTVPPAQTGSTRTVRIPRGATWTVPADFGSLVSAEAIGESGRAGDAMNGPQGYPGPGAGGGAYAALTTSAASAAIQPGDVLGIQIGRGGEGLPTILKDRNGTVILKADCGGSAYWDGSSWPTGGPGGAVANCIGDVKYAGGAGGSEIYHGSNYPGDANASGAGGGGAGGPNGPGADGHGAAASGMGGGGADGGSMGGSAASTYHDSGGGGNNVLGTGGGAPQENYPTATWADPPTDGGGGSGGLELRFGPTGGAARKNLAGGTMWGSGGGGGGGGQNCPGGAGGGYGGGPGGAGQIYTGGAISGPNPAGAPSPGTIVVVYNVAVAGTTANATGVAGTGAAGSLSIIDTETLSGVTATGQVGTAAASTGLNVAVTGVAATGQAGTASVTAAENLAGVAATGAAGSVASSVSDSASISGAAATGQVGGAGFTLSIAAVGIGSAGGVGAAGVSLSPTVSVSGVQATGQVGSVAVTIGQTVAATGVSATGAAGSVSETVADSVTPTGVAGTGQAAALSVTAAEPLLGVAATGSANPTAVQLSSSLAIQGVSASGAAGSFTFVSGSGAPTTGVAGTGQVGVLVPHGAANATVTGVTATGQASTSSVQDTIGAAGVPGVAGVGQVAGSSTRSIGGSSGVAGVGQVAFLLAAGGLQVVAVGQAGVLSGSSGRNVAAAGVAATGLARALPGAEASSSLGVAASGQAGPETFGLAGGIPSAVAAGQAGGVRPRTGKRRRIAVVMTRIAA